MNLKQEIDYLTKFQHKSSNFYGLPEIHKTEMKNKISEYISYLQPNDLKLHPIKAGYKCPTKCLSNFVNILLKAIFLQKLKAL